MPRVHLQKYLQQDKLTNDIMLSLESYKKKDPNISLIVQYTLGKVDSTFPKLNIKERDKLSADILMNFFNKQTDNTSFKSASIIVISLIELARCKNYKFGLIKKIFLFIIPYLRGKL